MRQLLAFLKRPSERMRARARERVNVKRYLLSAGCDQVSERLVVDFAYKRESARFNAAYARASVCRTYRR